MLTQREKLHLKALKNRAISARRAGTKVVMTQEDMALIQKATIEAVLLKGPLPADVAAAAERLGIKV